MLLKICGVSGESAERDIQMLASADIDLVGLWQGIPGDDLSTSELTRLAAVARKRTVAPVLVTFESDVSVLASVLRASGVTCVQLHAYQLPGVVRELKALLGESGVTIVKVLHIRGEQCLDLSLVRAYENAGADAFLLDVTSRDGRVGSTGESIAPDVAASVVARLNRPFFLAGGLSAASRGSYDELVRHEGFAGIDVSSAAREPDGRLCLQRIESIERAWRSELTEERSGVL